jgi:hypothetical protein
MRILVTGSRMPFALGIVRKLADAGHESEAHSLRDQEQLFVAMAGDISWDGEPIAGMSQADASLLEGLSEASP